MILVASVRCKTLSRDKSSMRNRFAVVAAVAALPFASAAAQNPPHRNIISIQPLSAILTVYSAEYEHAAKKTVSWGIGATYWSTGSGSDQVTYTSGDFKLRYYPNGIALDGVSVGGSVGASSIKGTSTTGGAETVSAPSLGMLIEYQWLLGEEKHLALALGAGAKMLIVNSAKISSSSFIARYPTLRISLGYAY
jgi:hypothetical protein